MRSLSGPTITALSGSQLCVVQLILLGFSVPIALNTSNLNLTYSSQLYLGAAGLGSISVIDDSPGEVKGISLELSGVDSSYIALALDDSNVVQGTPITIRTAILDTSYAIVDAPIEWTGRLDTMTIQEDGEKCTIQATAESTAVDLLRGSALTNSDADQQALHPGDRFFEHVIPQANKPVIWPSKLWFIAMGPRG